MWPILVNVPCELEKNVFCYSWMKYSINVNKLQLLDGAFQFNYIFSLIFCQLDLSTADRIVTAPTVIVDVCFSFQFYLLLLFEYFESLLGTYILRIVCLLRKLAPLSLCNLSKMNILKSNLSKMNIAIPGFFKN